MKNDPAKTPRPKVLIVHYMPSFTRLLALNLENEFEVVQANSCEAALQMLAAGSCSVILLEALMPGTHGRMCLDEFQQGNINIPVILMSATITNETAERIPLPPGVSAWYPLPINLDRLTAMIKAAMKSQSTWPSAAASEFPCNRPGLSGDTYSPSDGERL